MDIEFYRYEAFEEATRQVKAESKRLQEHFDQERRQMALVVKQQKGKSTCTGQPRT